MPMILGNSGLAPLIKVLGHRYWVPFTKLTFGVFLCNSVLMEFRTFNLTNGIWVEQYDLILLFLSYIVLSFAFSLITYLFVEAPMANLLYAFIVAKSKKEQDNNQFFYS